MGSETVLWPMCSIAVHTVYLHAPKANPNVIGQYNYKRAINQNQKASDDMTCPLPTKIIKALTQWLSSYILCIKKYIKVYSTSYLLIVWFIFYYYYCLLLCWTVLWLVWHTNLPIWGTNKGIRIRILIKKHYSFTKVSFIITFIMHSKIISILYTYLCICF